MASGIFTLKQQLQGLIQGAWAGTSSSNAPKNVEYLVVAGGGSGAGNRGLGGGGGAGGLLTGMVPVVAGTSYTVTIGAGGVDSGSANGGVGGNSAFGSIGASGGGTGGEASASASGYPGGSGGGGGNCTVGRPPGSGVSGQGNYGGTGYSGGSPYGGGGGGGAGTVGLNATPAGGGGNGGAGIASAISGTVVAYAGGGGGAAFSTVQGTGGVGGGGAGSGGFAAPTAGSANTGGGGGSDGRQTQGGNGGSGIVIVRYRGNVQFFSGGTLSYDSVNNYTVHTFYSSGTLAPLATPVTYGTTSSLTKSLRFRSSNSAYLNRTFSAGNQQKFTYSVWFKRSALGALQELLSAGSSGSSYCQLRLNSADTLQLSSENTSLVLELVTTQVFRDTSAWYHLVVSVDTTQSTSSDRVKFYLNGTQITSFSSSTYPTQNTNLIFNSNVAHYIGRISYSSVYYYDGYMTEVNFIDGQALTPQSFGQYDTTSGVWQPMTFVGTYGTNGFYLPFTNTTSTTTLGYDSSGNSNNWTTNNISLTAGRTYDSMNDVPTLTSATASNYAVFNPIGGVSNPSTITDGNLYVTTPATGVGTTVSTIQIPSSGQYYCEITFVTDSASAEIGIVDFATINTNFPLSPNCVSYASSGVKFIDGSSSTYGSSYTTGDIIGLAINANTGSITFYKNNTSQGTITHAVAGLVIAVADGSNGAGGSVFAGNFGQQPFTYTPPSGYVALNTYNLPTPAIVRSNQYMDATLYNGTGNSQTVMNAGSFQPDFVWLKSRSSAYAPILFDSIRGTGTADLASNSPGAEGVFSVYSNLTSFNTNGFSLGLTSSTDVLNSSGLTMVAWQWQAGKGTNSTNTNGTITSTVSVNTTSGFSIVTYTGNGTVGATIGHGLGVAPSMIYIKGRSNVDNWHVYSSATGNTGGMFLNSTSAFVASSYFWNNTSPSSTVFTLSNSSSNNSNGVTYVAYCFAPIAGFSAFGSYTGNGSTDGPFVFTNFKARWLLIKKVDDTQNWFIYDTSRSPSNVMDDTLEPNLSDAENLNDSTLALNVVSNGFKIKTTGSGVNTSGSTYIYMAFASNPFKYSNAF